MPSIAFQMVTVSQLIDNLYLTKYQCLNGTMFYIKNASYGINCSQTQPNNLKICQWDSLLY